MIANPVACGDDLFKNFGMLANVVSDAKEKSFGPILLQSLQNPCGHFRNGTIVKGKIQLLLLARSLPGSEGKKHFQQIRRFHHHDWVSFRGYRYKQMSGIAFFHALEY